MKPRPESGPDIARLMQYNVESAGFSVVRGIVGTASRRSLCTRTEVPNFVTAEQNKTKSLRGDSKLPA
jgi:hypothetical protein